MWQQRWDSVFQDVKAQDAEILGRTIGAAEEGVRKSILEGNGEVLKGLDKLTIAELQNKVEQLPDGKSPVDEAAEGRRKNDVFWHAETLPGSKANENKLLPEIEAAAEHAFERTEVWTETPTISVQIRLHMKRTLM
jgi:hypothetical protein